MNKTILPTVPANLQPAIFNCEVFASAVTITPEMAKYYLDHLNPTNNRQMAKEVVKRYVADILQNNWFLNGETIIFDRDGNLLDGQHRLAACVRSQKPITTMIVVGIDKKCFTTINVGKARNAADALRVANVPNSATCARAIGKVLAYRKGYCPLTAEGNQNTTNTDKGCRNSITCDEYEAHSDKYSLIVRQALAFQRQHKNDYDTIRLSVGDIAGLTALLHIDLGHPLDKCENFFNSMLTLGTTSKLMQSLRKILMEDKVAIMKMNPRQVQYCLTKAWSLYLAGKTEQKMTISTEELAVKEYPAFEGVESMAKIA